jgi:hypothetical protein
MHGHIGVLFGTVHLCEVYMYLDSEQKFQGFFANQATLTGNRSASNPVRLHLAPTRAFAVAGRSVAFQRAVAARASSS